MRIEITNWEQIRNDSPATGTKLSLHLSAGVLDVTVNGYYMPDDGYYDLHPNLTQHHKEVEEIFYDWNQIYSQQRWQSEKPYWFLFTHPQKLLPCIVEFSAYGWIRDDDYEPLEEEEIFRQLNS